MIRYRQFEPHATLRPYIDAYWTISTAEQSLPLVHRVLPDGCTDLICNLGPAVSSSNEHAVLEPEQVCLIGTMTCFSDTLVQPEASLTGIRFKPGAFSLFFPFSLQGMANCCVAQDRHWLDVFAKTDFVASLDGYLLRHCTAPSHALLPVINTIVQHQGKIKIEALARQHFITRRQLERHFERQLGISPKAFANIIRYRAALEQIRNNTSKESLESLAFDYGYYDHAHLANDIKAYTGLTPSQL